MLIIPYVPIVAQMQMFVNLVVMGIIWCLLLVFNVELKAVKLVPLLLLINVLIV